MIGEEERDSEKKVPDSKLDLVFNSIATPRLYDCVTSDWIGLHAGYLIHCPFPLAIYSTFLSTSTLLQRI